MSDSLYTTVLRLQNGTTYKGWSFFPLSFIYGEIVFNTSMTGYQEVFSDPSYSGQMVVFTCPEIGNTGLNKQDNESNFVHIKALIAKNISSISSNWRSKISLKDYLIYKRIPHIFGLDTRSLAQRLRLFGVTTAVLFNSNNDTKIANSLYLPNLDLMRKITSRKVYNCSSSAFQNLIYTFPTYLKPYSPNIISKQYLVAVIDMGLKFNILRKLLLSGCNIYIFPATSSYKSILKYNPDGILLSNGPGDPSLSTYVVTTVKKLVKFSNVPIFGICMGHQILNLALGAETFKLKFGHRGLNHPSGIYKYSEITSQNHGFAISTSCFIDNQELNKFSAKYLNLNDSTISGTFHKKLPVFSVQYHPESSPGPHDSEYLFRVFIELIRLIKFE
uniref:Carbamoyl phosphate synthase small chain n=1 Tax=Dipterosiphonia australica TaxID=2007208 RepID=A0A1Z1MLS2_9FLOR|nr:carbamoyl phosphate synthase small subunit [Dipterosiphonia australica]ARW66745.1 carbamoyl phosphate synthase small subunit [Dipterosiphonia australica]